MEIPDFMKELMQERDNIESEMQSHIDFLNGYGMPGADGPLVDQEGFPRNDIDIIAVRTARHRVNCLRNDLKAVNSKLEEGLHEIHKSTMVSVPRERNRSVGKQSSLELLSSGTGLSPHAGDDTTLLVDEMLVGNGQHHTSGGPGPYSIPSSTKGLVGSDHISDEVLDDQERLQHSVGKRSSGSTGSTKVGAETSTSVATVQGGPVKVSDPRVFAIVDEISPSSPAEECGLQIGDEIVQFGAVTKTSPDCFNEVANEVLTHVDKLVEVKMLRWRNNSVDTQEKIQVSLQLRPHNWDGPGVLGCHISPVEVSDE
eukprot:Filipodium_phascolosomae@DN2994_c0_g1_i1.p1